MGFVVGRGICACVADSSTRPGGEEGGEEGSQLTVAQSEACTVLYYKPPWGALDCLVDLAY